MTSHRAKPAGSCSGERVVARIIVLIPIFGFASGAVAPLLCDWDWGKGFGWGRLACSLPLLKREFGLSLRGGDRKRAEKAPTIRRIRIWRRRFRYTFYGSP